MITRPALRYLGGKWRDARWIISHFPKHMAYVEPCGGASSVLLQKPPCSGPETFNDLDLDVLNFFRVLREMPEELVRRIELTPFHRAEFDAAHEGSADPVERARRFYVFSMMNITGAQSQRSSGARFLAKPDARHIPAQTEATADHLLEIAKRLKPVQFECMDAIDCIRKYAVPGGLVYFDPPYLRSVRDSSHVYNFEPDDFWHARAAEAIIDSGAFAVVSGYFSELYNDLYTARGFTRKEKATRKNGNRNAVECLWLSPNIPRGLF